MVFTIMEVSTNIVKLAPRKVIEVPAHPRMPEHTGHAVALGVWSDVHELLLHPMGLKLRKP